MRIHLVLKVAYSHSTCKKQSLLGGPQLGTGNRRLRFVLFCFVASLGTLVKDREMPRRWGYR